MKYSIGLRSVRNARELGGYSLREGTVRKGVLLRTAQLTDLSAEDIRRLKDVFHTAAVVDFRGSLERNNAPDLDIPGAVNHHFPVLELEEMPGFNEEVLESHFRPSVDQIEVLREAAELDLINDRLYVTFLLYPRGKKAFRDFFRVLLDLPEGRAVAWHCADGKDRTGIASMLLLTALGASRETIMEDYLLTNTFNAEKLDAVRESIRGRSLSPREEELILFGSGAVFARYLENAMDALEREYGSVLGYLSRELRVGEAEIETLKQKFIV